VALATFAFPVTASASTEAWEGYWYHTYPLSSQSIDKACIYVWGVHVKVAYKLTATTYRKDVIHYTDSECQDLDVVNFPGGIAKGAVKTMNVLTSSPLPASSGGVFYNVVLSQPGVGNTYMTLEIGEPGTIFFGASAWVNPSYDAPVESSCVSYPDEYSAFLATGSFTSVDDDDQCKLVKPYIDVAFDTDQDRVGNYVDNCSSVYNTHQFDRDDDGIGNRCDGDFDNDGDVDGDDFSAFQQYEVPFGLEEDEEAPAGSNFSQFVAFYGSSLGASGLGDSSDGDGIIDIWDNCPLVANADQLDQNGDRIGDACAPEGIVNFESVGRYPTGLGFDLTWEFNLPDPCAYTVRLERFGQNRRGDRFSTELPDPFTVIAEVPMCDYAYSDTSITDDIGNSWVYRMRYYLTTGAPDADGDDVPDRIDNCSDVANPATLIGGLMIQSDQDGDGRGDLCDCDLDQDGDCDASGDLEHILNDICHYDPLYWTESFQCPFNYTFPPTFAPTVLSGFPTDADGNGVTGWNDWLVVFGQAWTHGSTSGPGAVGTKAEAWSRNTRLADFVTPLPTSAELDSFFVPFGTNNCPPGLKVDPSAVARFGGNVTVNQINATDVYDNSGGYSAEVQQTKTYIESIKTFAAIHDTPVRFFIYVRNDTALYHDRHMVDNPVGLDPVDMLRWIPRFPANLRLPDCPPDHLADPVANPISFQCHAYPTTNGNQAFIDFVDNDPSGKWGLHYGGASVMTRVSDANFRAWNQQRVRTILAYVGADGLAPSQKEFHQVNILETMVNPETGEDCADGTFAELFEGATGNTELGYPCLPWAPGETEYALNSYFKEIEGTAFGAQGKRVQVLYGDEGGSIARPPLFSQEVNDRILGHLRPNYYGPRGNSPFCVDVGY